MARPVHRLLCSSPHLTIIRRSKQNNPDGSWVLGNVLKSDFTQNPVGMRMLNRRGWLKTLVLKDTQKLDAVLRLLDWLATDEGNTVTQYGVEGQTFEYQPDGKIKNLVKDEESAQYGLYQCNIISRDLNLNKIGRMVKSKRSGPCHGGSEPCRFADNTGSCQVQHSPF